MAPTSSFKQLKERARSDLERLKNRLRYPSIVPVSSTLVAEGARVSPGAPALAVDAVAVVVAVGHLALCVPDGALGALNKKKKFDCVIL